MRLPGRFGIWWCGKERISLCFGFPKHETYGLASQMRRAAVSIPANIAEGFRRRSKVEKVRYLNIAEASLEESRYYLILAQDLHYGDTKRLGSDLEEVSRLLSAYAGAILTPDSHIPKGYFEGLWPSNEKTASDQSQGFRN